MARKRAAWRDAPKSATSHARQIEAARRIRDGRIKVPLACGYCNSPSIIDAKSNTTDIRNRKEAEALVDVLQCVQCGRFTRLETARKLRKQKITAIIQRGVDIELVKR